MIVSQVYQGGDIGSELGGRQMPRKYELRRDLRPVFHRRWISHFSILLESQRKSDTTVPSPIVFEYKHLHVSSSTYHALYMLIPHISSGTNARRLGDMVQRMPLFQRWHHEHVATETLNTIGVCPKAIRTGCDTLSRLPAL